MSLFDETILGAGWAGLLCAKKDLKKGVGKISLIEADRKDDCVGGY